MVLTKITCQKGLTLFEVLIVVIVVSIIFIFGYKTYVRSIEKSKHSVITHQANVFSRMVANISAIAKGTHVKSVDIDGVVINLNEYFHPANTGQGGSPLSSDQTIEECQQLWEAVFNNSPATNLSGNTRKMGSDYKVSIIDNKICRYVLDIGREDKYFFDYDVITGAVTTGRM